MKKAVFFVVLVVMVALSLSPIWAQGTVGQVTGPDNHLNKKRIFVRFEFAGDAYNLYDWFPRYFQTKVAQSNRVDVEVWDGDFRTVTEAQDIINKSGRYSPETAKQVPIGQMHAPTDYYCITVDARVKRINLGINLATKLFGGTDIQVGDHVTFSVSLNVQPWDIKTGRLKGGWIASGSAKGLDGVGVYNYRGWRGQSINMFTSNIERTLEGKAAKKAVEDFLRRFKP